MYIDGNSPDSTLSGCGKLLHVRLSTVIYDGPDPSCIALEGHESGLRVARLHSAVNSTDGFCHCKISHVRKKQKQNGGEGGEKQRTLDITKRSIVKYTKCKNSYPEDIGGFFSTILVISHNFPHDEKL